MFTIDLVLKFSPIPVSVQRKEEADAKALYQQIVQALSQTPPQLIQLTCEKQPDKQVAVMSDQISAVVVSEKSAAMAGRSTGFFVSGE
ncbi:hypothetical protein [Spirulina subsalsa]|uniref:hypothetical protein n=1 Tax=Spirulina subsalsa TaxID=54311 RepID=UPI00030EDF9C|nr:hypothetical protein [Spirulina subsalsa]